MHNFRGYIMDIVLQRILELIDERGHGEGTKKNPVVLEITGFFFVYQCLTGFCGVCFDLRLYVILT